MYSDAEKYFTFNQNINAMKKRIPGCMLIIMACFVTALAQNDPVHVNAGKHIVIAPDAPKAIGPYSQAVEINGMLFISGQVSLDPETNKLAGEDITTQTVQVMKNIGLVLKAAGYDYKDVVKSTCFLSNMENFKAMNAVYGKYYPTDPPARATVEVAKLPLGALIEIETIAVKQK
jgi:2-iminobutanoate/2-iminopropanoate deaminase